MNPNELRELQEGKAAYDAAIKKLVAKNCPGEHKPVQHRDRKPPWCHLCGCTADGNKVGRIRT